MEKIYYDYFFKTVWFFVDWLMPKKNSWWAFSTHHLKSHLFIENQRALFEAVKKDRAIKKIVFYRAESVDFEIEDAVNFEVVKYGTIRSFLLLAKCKVLFLTHSIPMDYSIRWGKKDFAVVNLNIKDRVVVNLWHGIALKRLLDTANGDVRRHTERVSYRRRERKYYSGLIASSDIDSYAMTTMFHPLRYDQVWTTGLPRNDFLVKAYHELPAYIRESIDTIGKIKSGKKLVVYAPTYRQVDVVSDAFYYQFSDDEIEQIKQVLKNNNAIMGYRPHYFKNSSEYFNMDKFIDNEFIFDLSHNIVSDISAIVRECDVLVTDYSSVYIEALYLDKPIVSFSYDFENYKNKQDGILYDMEIAFPGKINIRFMDAIMAIETSLSPTYTPDEQYKIAKKVFYNFHDENNAARVLEKITNVLINDNHS